MSNELSVSKPSFLMNREGSPKGIKEVREYAKPPRIKIVQSLSEEPFKPRFVDGDIIVNPYLIQVGGLNSVFTFTPIYHFRAWVCLNHNALKESLPMIRETTLDPKHDVALKAKKFTEEPCPEDSRYTIRYVTVLNFIIMIESEQEVLKSTPCALTFMKGEFKTGEALNNMILSRGVDIFANRFCAHSGLHKGKKGKWFGLDFVENPEPWVSEEQYNAYNTLFDQYEQFVKDSRIIIDMGDTDMEGEDTVTDSKF